ncbi:unnamed protein product [Owenia fusiformis]|uniref:Uncharacterized protein n=1 Tax=Owenia fusiformis TaxID=6347 RepID=A0A8J1UT68_OWEFU|nr:unnamed protein product [Owenia fusiformis]
MSYHNNHHYQQRQQRAQPPVNNEPLPPDWEMLIDPQTGWPFFVNHREQKTTWSDPRRHSHATSGHQDGVQIPIVHEGSGHNQERPQQMPPQQQNWGPQQSEPMDTNHSNPSRQFVGSPHRSSPQRFSETARHSSPKASPVLRRTEFKPSKDSGQKAWEIPIAHGPGNPPEPERQSRPQQPQQQYSAEPTAKPTEAKSGAFLQKPEDVKPRSRSPSPAPKLTPMETIEKVLSEAMGYQTQIEDFTGSKQDKQYKMLEEMLTRSLLKLDLVESNGQDEIRQARKKTVKYIQSCLDQLELKAMSNEAPSTEHVKEQELGSELKC